MFQLLNKYIFKCILTSTKILSSCCQLLMISNVSILITIHIFKCLFLKINLNFSSIYSKLHNLIVFYSFYRGICLLYIICLIYATFNSTKMLFFIAFSEVCTDTIKDSQNPQIKTYDCNRLKKTKQEF